MKKILLVAITALAIPASAVAADDATTSASAACKAQRTQIGAAAFKDLYGTNKSKSNAFGKCVSKQTKADDAARTEAKSACKTEQEDANFPAAHDGKTFAQYYGTNKNGKNAYGKCVSGKAKAASEKALETRINAAKTCKQQRKDDAAAFAAKWGTKKNAFGKCVSATAKADDDAAAA